MTKLQLPNLNLSVVNVFPNINISNSKKHIKFWVCIFSPHTRVTSIKSTKQELGSESVTREADDRTRVQQKSGLKIKD